jgi:hypothetical protein
MFFAGRIETNNFNNNFVKEITLLNWWSRYAFGYSTTDFILSLSSSSLHHKTRLLTFARPEP